MFFVTRYLKRKIDPLTIPYAFLSLDTFYTGEG